MELISRTLSKEQKLGAAALAVFVVAGFVMIIYSFGVRVKRPFQLQTAHILNEIESLRTQSRLADALGGGSEGDTDADGLSDSDELNVYKTSPYLGDTDADGKQDGKEVEPGTDPNCPIGPACSRDVYVPPTSGEAATTQGTVPLDPQTQALLSQVQTPQQVRALLLQIGVPEADVAGYDDATLMQIFQESFTQAQQSGVPVVNSGATVLPVPQAPPPAQGPALPVSTAAGAAVVFQGLQNATEVRQFLLKNSVDQSVLDQLSDEELMQAFQKTLEQLSL